MGALGLGTAKRGCTTSSGLVVVSLSLRDLFLWHTVGYLAADLPDLGSVFYSELFVSLCEQHEFSHRGKL